MMDYADLRSAYQTELSDYWMRLAKVSALVAMVLIPAGITLDYAVYPKYVKVFAVIRLLCLFVIFISFLLYYTALGRRLLRAITFLWLLATQVMICYMIFMTEGPVSPYYAGLNLAVLAVGIFLPTNVYETLFFCVMTLFFYLLSVTSFDISGEGFSAVVYNNIFFLVLTAVVTAFASHFGDRRRFEEFRLNYELDQRNRELAELDKAKTEFFSNISHELRTPLTLILSPVQDLLESQTPLTDKVASALGVVRNNALRLLKLVNDLLDVIRLEEAKLDFEKVPVAVDPLVAGICDSIGYLADMQGVELKRLLNASGQLVLADVAAMEKVFINILNNAVKFSDKGGLVQVSSVETADNIKVTVEDTGIGIAAKDLPFIFDRFRQADGSSTRCYGGTGLGLALAKEIVERHSGRVRVDSVLGQGTTVTVELPKYRAIESEGVPAVDRTPLSIGLQRLHRLAEVNAGLTVHAEDGSESIQESRNGGADLPSVLVVDDEPDMRQYLVSMLTEDYVIYQADNGAKGLKLARDKLPDTMLLDLMLPEIDGLEVCRLLKEDVTTRGIRIILLTARVDEEAKLTALKNGADDFITKPFSRLEVRSRLANLYKATRMERDLANSNEKLKETLSSLKATQAQLIQSEKLNALGRLAAGLLHEINNPLNYSLTALQLIQGDSSIQGNELLQEVVGDIDEGMQRIRTIISDLRAFAYPSEADKRSYFDIGEALESAIRFTSHELRGISVESDLPTGTIVVGSKNHITQVLVNLLSNSVKAIQEAGGERSGTIRVTGAVRDSRLVVTLADNGVGMDGKTLERIFDPFFTTRDVGEGMGLGLSVCHTIVANHGGRILAHSEPGEGTQFVFDLPLEADSDGGSC
jgi:signal transduction histidine kinase